MSVIKSVVLSIVVFLVIVAGTPASAAKKPKAPTGSTIGGKAPAAAPAPAQATSLLQETLSQCLAGVGPSQYTLNECWSYAPYAKLCSPEVDKLVAFIEQAVQKQIRAPLAENEEKKPILGPTQLQYSLPLKFMWCGLPDSPAHYNLVNYACARLCKPPYDFYVVCNQSVTEEIPRLLADGTRSTVEKDVALPMTFATQSSMSPEALAHGNCHCHVDLPAPTPAVASPDK